MVVHRAGRLRRLAVAELTWAAATVLRLSGVVGGRRTTALLLAAGLALLPLRAAAVVGALRRADRAEQLLARRMAPLRDVVGAGSWSLDEHGRFSHADETFAELFGHRPDDLLGERPLLLLAPDDHQRRAAMEATLAAHASFVRLVFRGRHAAGHDVWAEASAVPFYGPNGEFAGYDGAIRPLSDERRRTIAESQVRSRIERVLATRGVEIVLQPIVDLATLRVVGVEALSRFHGSPIPPDQWFRDAASVGLGVELELLAVELALARLDELPLEIGLSVNASPETLADPRLRDVLLAERPACPRIVVELTEHTRIDDYESLGRSLRPLRLAGVRLAVDDAGAGYASFRHVVKLEPDIIKLDRGVVAGIDRSPALRAFAMSVIVFAVETNTVVAAEGIETPGELRALTALSVDQGQGDLLGRPSPTFVGPGRSAGPREPEVDGARRRVGPA